MDQDPSLTIIQICLLLAKLMFKFNLLFFCFCSANLTKILWSLSCLLTTQIHRNRGSIFLNEKQKAWLTMNYLQWNVTISYLVSVTNQLQCQRGGFLTNSRLLTWGMCFDILLFFKFSNDECATVDPFMLLGQSIM